MQQNAILIFDIGKTNKKAIVFNEQLQVLASYSVQLEATLDEDGFPTEDLKKLSNWLISMLDRYLDNPDFQITAMNISAYGATLVHLGEDGKFMPPIYDYLKPIPTDCKEGFYNRYGGKAPLCIDTASPELGMLNTGIHLVWLKEHKSEKFQRVQHSLHLPQYLAYLVHGLATSEITSIGCHTTLWDFSKNGFHDWVQKEGIAEKLPKLYPTSHVVPVQRNGHQFNVGIGIHDSSASLIVYLKAISKPFLLVSTGTWSITLNAFSDDELTAADMQNDCLNYLGYEGQNVRASRLFLGNEHDWQLNFLAAQFNSDKELFKLVKPDWQLFKQMQQQTGKAKLIKFNGNPMLEIDFSTCENYEAGYHLLMATLLDLQVKSMKMAMGSTAVEDVYLSGGFCQNAIFIQFLPKLMPEYHFYLANINQSSALGAAAAIQETWQPELELATKFVFEKIG